MLTKFQNSWELVKSSARVLQADKELVIFPMISSVAVLLVTATFFIPLALFASGTSIPQSGEIFAYILLFLFYVVQYSVIFFFNSALVGAVMIRLDGGDPTVKDGFRIALQHLGPILGYALIASTVGLFLKAASERAGALGKFIISLVGIGWNLATFLVVPVLVTQNVGPIEAVKRSAGILKKTWGEQVIGNTGIGFLFMLLYIGWVILMVPLGIFAFSTGQPILIGSLVVIGVVGFLFLALMNATLGGIYQAALYRFATTGQSGPFATSDLNRAFLPKG